MPEKYQDLHAVGMPFAALTAAHDVVCRTSQEMQVATFTAAATGAMAMAELMFAPFLSPRSRT